MRVGIVADGIAELYVAVTLEVPPLPPFGFSVTVYVFGVHLAYSVALLALFQVLALAPLDV